MADEVIKTKEEAYNILTDAVEFELDVVRQEVELDKIDLFFFPIMQMRHYYVICINIKRKRIDILDNSSARVSNRDKYEEMPATVYMTAKGMEKRASLLAKIKPTRISMSWRDTTNVIDYGVFAMRHIETYKGEGLMGWDCGLRHDDKKQLLGLRVKYTAFVLLEEINEMKMENLFKTKEYAKLKTNK
ncbi:unnamed protein product [Cuscuta europaea]|uniref:Ubiquitin-like protease family profile domain-containing protein n=1 Tax=Cuscuta europaea TaxID=41803 RepID=A0A9P0ZQB0_CUSEU|nr:unnamed protein product [Cuscuta europaea]